MHLGFGELAAVLQRMHPHVARSVVEARLKYFQRQAFPSANLLVGTGWRAEYGARDLMRLMIAFELLAIGFAPASAASLVDGEWSAVSRRIAEGWIERATRGRALLLLVQLHGLGGRDRVAGRLAAGFEDDLRKWLNGGRGDPSAVTMLDVVRVAQRLRTALGEAVSAMRVDGVVAALDGWASSGNE